MSGVLGRLDLALGSMPAHQLRKERLEPAGDEERIAGKESYCTFQVLSASTVLKPRVVYFVRHAESLWNQAQGKGDVQAMAKTTDHSLSTGGRDSSLQLCERVKQGLAKGDQHAKDLVHAEALYVSPLTRAIQTAMIAFGQHWADLRPPGEVMLMGSAREKQNFGGLDSMSDKKGREILNHTFHELREMFEDMPDEQAKIDAAFRKLKWDVQDAEEEWWCPRNSDTSEELDLRLKDLMSQLLYTPHATSVVVGHSHFFRAVYKGFLSKEFKEKNPDFARKLQKEKMDNCGVIRIELDPRRDLLDGPITNAELVLNSRMIADGGGMMACCTAPSVDNDAELQPQPVEVGPLA